MPFSKPSQKSKLFDKLLSPDAVIAEIMEGKDDDAVFEKMLGDYKRKRMDISTKYVTEPNCVLSIGMFAETSTEGTPIFVQIALVTKAINVILWLAKDSESRLEKVKQTYVYSYRDKQSGLNDLNKTMEYIAGKESLISLFHLVEIEPRASGWLVGALSQGIIARSNKGQYSHDKAIDDHIGLKRKKYQWLHPDTKGSVDAYCGVKKPDDFEVYVLRQVGFITDREISLFKCSDIEDIRDISLGLGTDLLFFDTLKDALAPHNFEKRYTNGQSKKRILAVEVEAKTINGKTALRSWMFDSSTEVDAE